MHLTANTFLSSNVCVWVHRSVITEIMHTILLQIALGKMLSPQLSRTPKNSNFNCNSLKLDILKPVAKVFTRQIRRLKAKNRTILLPLSSWQHSNELSGCQDIHIYIYIYLKVGLGSRNRFGCLVSPTCPYQSQLSCLFSLD